MCAVAVYAKKKKSDKMKWRLSDGLPFVRHMCAVAVYAKKIKIQTKRNGGDKMVSRL